MSSAEAAHAPLPPLPPLPPIPSPTTCPTPACPAGNSLLLFYAPEIFQTIGSGQDTALLNTLILGGSKLVGTCLSLALIDRVGRKKLLVAGRVAGRI